MNKKDAQSRLVAGLPIMLILAACADMGAEPESAADVAAISEEVAELAPGFLQGYLATEEQLDSVKFVLPSPAPDSAMQAMDTTWSEQMLAFRDSPRWELAIRDADLSFPAAADAVSCALGIAISEEDTPNLYMLLRRTLTDIGLSPYAAKNAYLRERPFMVNDEPVCTPEDEELLRKDPSYPSGHTAIGWGWALILTELAPERTEEILARGRSFGESRNVCNVHWYHDVVAGRLTGAGAVARLHANPQFKEAMAAAGEDIARARESGLVPTIDCDAEAAALAMPLQ
jgi:acid phosphatase (class A)